MTCQICGHPNVEVHGGHGIHPDPRRFLYKTGEEPKCIKCRKVVLYHTHVWKAPNGDRLCCTCYRAEKLKAERAKEEA